jgi:hypothetical protein
MSHRRRSRDTVADASVSPVALRREAEKMRDCDLANEKAFLKQNDVIMLQPETYRPAFARYFPANPLRRRTPETFP